VPNPDGISGVFTALDVLTTDINRVKTTIGIKNPFLNIVPSRLKFSQALFAVFQRLSDNYTPAVKYGFTVRHQKD